MFTADATPKRNKNDPSQHEIIPSIIQKLKASIKDCINKNNNNNDCAFTQQQQQQQASLHIPIYNEYHHDDNNNNNNNNNNNHSNNNNSNNSNQRQAPPPAPRSNRRISHHHHHHHHQSYNSYYNGGHQQQPFNAKLGFDNDLQIASQRNATFMRTNAKQNNPEIQYSVDYTNYFRWKIKDARGNENEPHHFSQKFADFTFSYNTMSDIMRSCFIAVNRHDKAFLESSISPTLALSRRILSRSANKSDIMSARHLDVLEAIKRAVVAGEFANNVLVMSISCAIAELIAVKGGNYRGNQRMPRRRRLEYDMDRLMKDVYVPVFDKIIFPLFSPHIFDNRWNVIIKSTANKDNGGFNKYHVFMEVTVPHNQVVQWALNGPLDTCIAMVQWFDLFKSFEIKPHPQHEKILKQYKPLLSGEFIERIVEKDRYANK